MRTSAGHAPPPLPYQLDGLSRSETPARVALPFAFDTIAPVGCETSVGSQIISGNFPAWLRWAALAWLLVWVPAYWHTWGASNFLELCDIAVILTCLGLWTGSRLLISSQAVSSLVVDVVWILDASWRFLTGALFARRDGVFLRRPLSAVGPAIISLPRPDAAAAAVVASPRRLRSPGARVAIPDCRSRVYCLSIHQPRKEYEFRVRGPVLPSRVGAPADPRGGQRPVSGDRGLPPNSFGFEKIVPTTGGPLKHFADLVVSFRSEWRADQFPAAGISCRGGCARGQALSPYSSCDGGVS